MLKECRELSVRRSDRCRHQQPMFRRFSSRLFYCVRRSDRCRHQQLRIIIQGHVPAKSVRRSDRCRHQQPHPPCMPETPHTQCPSIRSVPTSATGVLIGHQRLPCQVSVDQIGADISNAANRQTQTYPSAVSVDQIGADISNQQFSTELLQAVECPSIRSVPTSATLSPDYSPFGNDWCPSIRSVPTSATMYWGIIRRRSPSVRRSDRCRHQQLSD